MTSRLSLCGACRQASRAAGPDKGRWHDRCPGGGCQCPHRRATQRRSVAAEVKKARLERLMAAGVPLPGQGGGSARERGVCRHDHVMTEENTGPRGECRACKREASARCKARKREREGAA